MKKPIAINLFALSPLLVFASASQAAETAPEMAGIVELTTKDGKKDTYKVSAEDHKKLQTAKTQEEKDAIVSALSAKKDAKLVVKTYSEANDGDAVNASYMAGPRVIFYGGPNGYYGGGPACGPRPCMQYRPYIPLCRPIRPIRVCPQLYCAPLTPYNVGYQQNFSQSYSYEYSSYSYFSSGAYQGDDWYYNN